MRTLLACAVLVLALGEIGCSSGSGGTDAGGGHGTGGTAGQQGATGGGAGHGSGGSGGAGGAPICGACQLQNLQACPTNVATADMCPSAGATCCTADLHEWQCSLCAAETCHWVEACSSAGSGGSGGGGAGGADAGTACDLTVHCPSGQTCIKGGTCAESCPRDGGTCPTGTTCQSTSGYCTGGACTALQVMVCL